MEPSTNRQSTHSLRQIIGVTRMNLKGIPLRAGTSMVIVIGMAGVVGVMMAVLAMANGFLKTFSDSGHADRIIIMSKGSGNLGASNLTREDVATIVDAPGIKHDVDGKPIVSAETFAAIPVVDKKSGAEVSMTLVGVGPKSLQLRSELTIVAGRMYQPAVHELVVGQMAQQRFKGLNVGDTVQVLDSQWRVVGLFAGNSKLFESSIITDNETLLSAYRRNSFAGVMALLESPAAFKTIKDSLTSNPTLQIEVQREDEYFAKSSQWMTGMLNRIAYLIGGIMAIGALFAALNTMYAAVSARTAEIATLRAIGFGATPVVVSIIIEAVLLALLGAVLGIAAAWLLFDGNAIRIGNLSLQQVITPALALRGVLLALVIGLLGGILPAMRAARLPVADALRAV